MCFWKLVIRFALKAFRLQKQSVFSFKCAVLNAKMCFGKLKWLTLTF